MYFRYFVRYHLPLIKGWALHLNWIPFTHGCFVLSLVEIGPVVLEIRDFFFISSMYFRWFVIIFPWKRARWSPSFEQTWIPFTQGFFVPSLFEIGPVVLEKKIKMWKVYDNDDDDNDNNYNDNNDNDDGQRKNFDQKSSKELQRE